MEVGVFLSTASVHLACALDFALASVRADVFGRGTNSHDVLGRCTWLWIADGAVEHEKPRTAFVGRSGLALSVQFGKRS